MACVLLAPVSGRAGWEKSALPGLVDFGKNEQDAAIYGGAGEELAIRYKDWPLQPSILVADVNADGIGDLITAGNLAVQVFFGKPDWAPVWDSTGVNAPGPDMVIVRSSQSPGKVYEDSIKTGDINGDGLQDLVLSGLVYDPAARCYWPECVYVVFGKSVQPGFLDLTSGQADITIRGTGRGYPMAVGDVTGDGFDDILVVGTGEVLAVFGGANLPDTLDLASAAGGFMEIRGPFELSALGTQSEMVLGDFNGDAILDFVVAKPYDWFYFMGERKEYYLFLGTSNFPLVWDLASRPADVALYGGFEALFDKLGVGDFNGDGLDDLVLNTPRAFQGSVPGLRIIHGRKNMPPEINLATEASVIIHSSSGYLGTFFGTLEFEPEYYKDEGFAVGDINGDGLDDLAAVHAQGMKGVYVVLGSEVMAPVIDVGSGQYDMFIHRYLEGFAYTSLLSTYFPGGVKMGDANGDGLMDIFISSPWFTARFGEHSFDIESGAAYVVYGAQSLSSLVNLNDMEADVTVLGPHAYAHMTSSNSMVFGDLNGDGVDDMVLGALSVYAPWDDPGAPWPPTPGAVYLLMGRSPHEQAAVKKTDHAGRGLARDYGTARAKISFDSGAASSLTSVTLTRGYTGVNLPDLSLAASVQWQVETDRTPVKADLTLKYLDLEVEGLNEASLALYRAPTPDGPFTLVESAVFDLEQNLVTATGLNSFSCFVLQEEALPPPCFLNSLPRLGAGR